MRDFIADWKRWSRAERVLAIVVALLMIALPLGTKDVDSFRQLDHGHGSRNWLRSV